MKKIGIIGLGWLGLPLAQHWQIQGKNIKGTCSNAEKVNLLHSKGLDACKFRFSEGELPLQWFDDICTLIIAVPPSKVGETYLSSLEKLSLTIGKSKVSKILFVSSIGVFDDDGRIVNENSTPSLQTDKARLLFDAEQFFIKMAHTHIVRLAGLYNEDRHPGRWFAGKENIPNGDAPINLISLEECILLFDKLLESENLPKIIHGVNKNHPTKMDFYTHKTLELNLKPPKFIPEKKAWKVVESLYNY